MKPSCSIFIILIFIQVMQSRQAYAISRELAKFLKINSPMSLVCDEDQFYEDLKQRCASKLCGPPGKHVGIYLSKDDISEENERSINKLLKEIEPHIEEAVGEAVKRNEIILSKFELYMSKGPMLNFEKWTDAHYSFFKGLYKKEFSKCLTDCKSEIQAYVTKVDLKDELTKLKGQNNQKKLVSDRMKLVKLQLVRRSMLIRNREALQLTNDAKTKIVTYLEKEFDAKAAANFDSYLKDIFVYDSDEVQNDTEYKDGVISVLTSQKKRLLESTDGLKNEADAWLAFFKIKNDPLSDLYLFSGVNSLATDKFMNDKEKINVSPYTCLYPNHGMGIVLHELGHALSFAIAKNKIEVGDTTKFQAMRDRAKSFYKMAQEASRTSFRHPGDMLYSEEDTADLLAFELTKESPQLNICSLMRTSFEKDMYDDLKLENDRLDDHAPTFLRLLKEAKSKMNTVPSECQQVIDQNKGYYDFNACQLKP